jgi:D-sedoheptulose 7-phosphate isomerase
LIEEQDLDFLGSYFEDHFSEHERVVREGVLSLRLPFEEMAVAILERMRLGGKLLLFGNGGSAGDSQHIATELTVRLKKDRRALPALALTTDTSSLTAIGNDYGFEKIFSRQIEALGCEGDVALGLTTSGSSPNVLRGLEEANRLGLLSVAWSGGEGGDLARSGLASHLLRVPSLETAHIQEVHIMLGHVLCGSLERGLGLV